MRNTVQNADVRESPRPAQATAWLRRQMHTSWKKDAQWSERTCPSSWSVIHQEYNCLMPLCNAPATEILDRW